MHGSRVGSITVAYHKPPAAVLSLVTYRAIPYQRTAFLVLLDEGRGEEDGTGDVDEDLRAESVTVEVIEPDGDNVDGHARVLKSRRVGEMGVVGRRWKEGAGR